MPSLFSKLSAEKVHIYGLVLTASGIAHQVRSRGRLWSIDVPVPYRSAACKAIAKYLKENTTVSPSGEPSFFPTGHKSFSSLYAVAPLVAIHWATAPGDGARELVARFGADAGSIMSGALYRCLTALLLHANWAHLLGNVVALVLFGTALALTVGWGLGWLLILLCGASGNLLTAYWYGSSHVSIGASTAVFSAVGLCAAVSFWRGYHSRAWSWRLWAPLAGGVALLGMLGSAPHTDLVAHMMGFVTGLTAGMLWGWSRLSAPWPFQLASALLTIGLVTFCWVWGMRL